MKRVSLVCSVHRERGLANVSELQAILERIGPDVIFLELPRADFDKYSMTPESTAASRYRDRAVRPVDLVPVDIPMPGREFRQHIGYLFDRVEGASSLYCQLSRQNEQYVAEYGFTYLNSVNCTALFSAIHATMRTTIAELGDPRLTRAWELWISANRQRERAMLDGVVDYSKQHPFKTGVLLVGAAHKQSVLERLEKEAGLVSSAILWGLAGFP